MERLMEMAGAKVVKTGAVFTEGDPNAWDGILTLGHLPLFKDG